MQKSKSYLTNTMNYYFLWLSRKYKLLQYSKFLSSNFKNILFMYIKKILIVLNNNFKLKKIN
jgi:hypothetical protein